MTQTDVFVFFFWKQFRQKTKQRHTKKQQHPLCTWVAYRLGDLHELNVQKGLLGWNL